MWQNMCHRVEKESKLYHPGGWGDRGSGTLEKLQVATGFLTHSGMDPLEKQLEPLYGPLHEIC